MVDLHGLPAPGSPTEPEEIRARVLAMELEADDLTAVLSSMSSLSEAKDLPPLHHVGRRIGRNCGDDVTAVEVLRKRYCGRVMR